MPKIPVRRLGVLIFCALMAAPAQDPGLKEVTALEQPDEADLRDMSLLVRQLMPASLSPELASLNSAINRATKSGDMATAWRLLSQMALALQGQSWNGCLEVLSSYRLEPGRRLLKPGEPVVARLSPLFTPGRPPRETCTLRLSLAGAQGRAVRPPLAVEVREFTPLHHEFGTRGLKDGVYDVVYELFSGAGERVSEVRRPVTLSSDLDRRLERLKRDLARAPRGTADLKSQAALESVEYLHGVIARGRKEYTASRRLRSHPMISRIAGADELGRYTGDPFDLSADLPLAERLSAAVLKKRDPFAGLTGNMRLAYRSPLDQSLQPFRVFVPARHQRRMLVALHGVPGDENSYFGEFTGGLLARLAGERGYVIASPNGRGAMGGYVGASRQDVDDVRERAVALFGIDPRRVFLTGHAVGAIGAFQIAFEKPELWAGVAPVAGVIGINRRMFERNPELPVLLIQGGKDRLMLPSMARTLAEEAKKTLRTFEYREYPEAGHFTIGAAPLSGLFDFFDRIQPGN